MPRIPRHEQLKIIRRIVKTWRGDTPPTVDQVQAITGFEPGVVEDLAKAHKLNIIRDAAEVRTDVGAEYYDTLMHFRIWRPWRVSPYMSRVACG